MNNGLITIGIFLIVQLVAAVWWASAMNTKMNFMLNIGKDMKAIELAFLEAQARYSTKEEVARTLAIADKQFEAMWKQIDILKIRGTHEKP